MLTHSSGRLHSAHSQCFWSLTSHRFIIFAGSWQWTARVWRPPSRVSTLTTFYVIKQFIYGRIRWDQHPIWERLFDVFKLNRKEVYLILSCCDFQTYYLYNLIMSKIRKVYNLRKTSNIKAINQPEESRVSNFRQQPQLNLHLTDNIQRNLSAVSQNLKEPHAKREESQQYQVEGEELVIDKLQLNFNVRLADIERKEVKVKNIGNSAVYLQFAFKNTPKINSSGFKDTRIKFYCHYENNVIKPGEENTFIFSFLSEFPGNFTEEVEIVCQPPLKTKIPNIKLSGKAFVLDEWEDRRSRFHRDIQEEILKEQIREILSDVVDQVKLPPPPKPDVNNPKVAEIQFQKNNQHLNLFYNQYLHKWFDELYNEICDQGHIQPVNRYWDQSVETLKQLVTGADYLQDVEKKCYLDRIQHYCYLSTTPLPNKSQLYRTIYQFMSNAAYHLGGDYVDAARKQLDMWEVAFREPSQNDTPEELKQRKEEVDKIKAEWVKKAKKKKWGPEEEAEIVNEFKKKVQAKTTENLLNRFTNFQENAEFIKASQFLQKSTFSLSNYQHFLERMKTVKEYPIEGKKVMIKWNLKLKENSEEKLKQLQDYLAKKKEEEKRLQEEKKNEGGKKKKAPAKPKKKGQKEQEQQKPLFFDFMSILDEENWNGFTQTFRIVMEKQPFLVMIGITYGPRSGRFLNEYSVHFLLEHLKTLQSSIEFFPHQNLPTLAEKIQTEVISEGSILLLENLNFLPYEVTQEEIEHHNEDNTSTISRRKLLHPQIREFYDEIGKSIDVLVNQDRYLAQSSGFSAYLNKQIILGSQWWKYVGLSMRINSANVIFGDDFNADNYVLLARLVETCHKIYLTGLSGLKFYLAKHKIDSLGTTILNKSERSVIEKFISKLEAKGLLNRIVIPSDFVLQKDGANVIFDGSQKDLHEHTVIDIGPSSISSINEIQQGSLFLLGETSIQRHSESLSASFTSILKDLYKKQQTKRQRHSLESSTQVGINYNDDIVVYLIGANEALIEKIELRDKKKVKISQEENQDPAQEEQQGGEADKKKVDLISDFRLSSLSCLYRLWRGKFDQGLKDINKYPEISD